MTVNLTDKTYKNRQKQTKTYKNRQKQTKHTKADKRRKTDKNKLNKNIVTDHSDSYEMFEWALGGLLVVANAMCCNLNSI